MPEREREREKREFGFTEAAGRAHWFVNSSEAEAAGIGAHQTVKLNPSKWNDIKIPTNTPEMEG